MNRKQRRAAGKIQNTNSQVDSNAARSLRNMDVLFESAFRHFQSGNFARTSDVCNVVCRAMPNHAGAIHLLGLIAHKEGRYDEAIVLLKRAIASKPDFFWAYNNLGVVLCQIGRSDEGIASYQRAVSLNPDYAVAHSNLGAAYTDENRPEEAVTQCQKALQLKPEYAQAHYNLATAFYRLGQTAEAIDHFERALAINPSHAEAQLAVCMAELPIIFTDEAEVRVRRGAYEKRLNKLMGARRTLANLADAIGTAQPFRLAYQGYNDRELQSRYGSLICRVMAERYPPVKAKTSVASSELIRVGIVSGYFRQHSNWKIPVKGWISQLDRQRFQIFGYHTGLIRDDQTVLAARMCDRFVQGPLPINAWRNKILSDAPHVLIYPEIGMDPVAVKLAAQRLAPVQCNSWGHPETSGFPTLDYYLSSELMEPTDGSAHYTEKLVRLPHLSIYYEPPAAKPASSSRLEHGLRPSAAVFWCGQSLFKYLPQFDYVFPRIAQEVSDCQFVFIHFPTGAHIKSLFSRRLDLAFSEYGLNFQEYCVIQPQLDPSSFASVLERCDIVLDSFLWSGCNSSLESLQFDLPIVTMPGPLMRSRHTLAILTMMDVHATVASSIDEYVEIAVRLANEPAWRTEIKKAIARNKHRVYHDRTCIDALEQFLLCKSQPA
jgi:protein O-GlcNAc transferase